MKNLIGDPPRERKPVEMKSVHLILDGVNTNILSVGRCKLFELVS